jgi:hypothetical protein
MEICQRQEDSGSSIISNTSLNGLAYILLLHRNEPSDANIWKNSEN